RAREIHDAHHAVGLKQRLCYEQDHARLPFADARVGGALATERRQEFAALRQRAPRRTRAWACESAQRARGRGFFTLRWTESMRIEAHRERAIQHTHPCPRVDGGAPEAIFQSWRERVG